MKESKKKFTTFKYSMFYKWYKELPVALVGFLVFFLIIFFLTIILNWHWSGLGLNQNRSFILPLTNDSNEFIQYATLYMYLLSFGATIFTGFAVFLVFNDWKDQHNASLIKEQTIELIKKIKHLKEAMLIPLSIKMKYDFEKKYNVGSDNLKSFKNTEFLLQQTRASINNISNMADQLRKEITDYVIILQIKDDFDKYYNKYDDIISPLTNIMERLNEVETNETQLIKEYEDLFEDFSNEYAEISAKLLFDLILPLAVRLRAQKKEFKFNKVRDL